MATVTRTWKKVVLSVCLVGFGAAMVLMPSPVSAGTLNGGWASPLDPMPGISAGFKANDCGHPEYGTYTGHGDYHLANDYGVGGGADVFAIGPGNVVAVQTGWPGSAVFIVHTDANGHQFLAVYAHIVNVVTDSTVAKGQKIGDVYNWGGNSHLHFGIRDATVPAASNNGNMPCSSWPNTNGYVDPMPFLSSHPRVNADSDNDGVPNEADVCPSQKGSVFANGCPDGADAGPIMAVGSEGTLYSLHVTDDHCARIYRRGLSDAAFGQLTTISPCTWTTAGTTDMALVPNTDDQAWIALLDILNADNCGKLYLFKLNGTTVANEGNVGKVACGWSKHAPPSITVDSTGNVYVASTKSGSLYVFKRAPDGTMSNDNSGPIGFANSWSDYSGAALTVSPDDTLWLVAAKKSGDVWSFKRESDGTWVNKGELGSGGWSTNAKPALAVDHDGDITVALVKKGTNAAGHVQTYRRCGTCIKWHYVGQVGSQAWSSEGTFDLAAAPDDKVWLSLVKYQDSGADMYSYLLTPDPDKNHLGTWAKIGRMGVAKSWSPFVAPSVVVSSTGTPFVLAIKKSGHMYAMDYSPVEGWTSHGKIGGDDWAGDRR